MTLTGFPFVFDPMRSHALLTPDEHDGLCCLLARAQHYGGAGDVVFLCLSGCSALVRFAPEHDGGWRAAGYAFQKQQEPWVWLYLPSLLGTVCEAPSADGHLRFRVDTAARTDDWLERSDPALWRGARRLADDTARQLQPYCVGFTHLDPARYGDAGIRWYRLTPHREAEAHVPALDKAEMDDCRPLFEADSGVRIVPPRVTQTWRVARGDQKARLGPVDRQTDWYAFVDRVRKTAAR